MPLLLLPSLSACGTPSKSKSAKVEPAIFEKGEGDAPNRITLTEHAAKRLGIQFGAVSAPPAGSAKDVTRAVPASAVYFDATGAAWVFVQVAPLVFSHHAVQVQHLDTKTALLTAGPPLSTQVVTVGVPELNGADNGLGY